MKALAAWVFCALAALATSAQAQPQAKAPKSLPLPDVRKGVTLRVAYVHNPRFPALPAAQLGRVLTLASGHLKRHVGLEVAFAPPVELPIIKVFAALSPRLAVVAEAQRLDPGVNEVGMDRLSRHAPRSIGPSSLSRRLRGNCGRQSTAPESALSVV